MIVYFFGNEDVKSDSVPLKILKHLQQDFPHITFKTISPNQDLPDEMLSQDTVFIVDTMSNITKPTIISENEINAISTGKSTTAHDYDLGFQLKYMAKLNKLNKVRILGIPMTINLGKNQDYKTFQSIFKKFVAQDIQGS